jgi:hypothetical protein
MDDHEMWVLGWLTDDGQYAVGSMQLPVGTTLTEATELAYNELADQGLLLNSITNSVTLESGHFGFAASNAPEVE